MDSDAVKLLMDIQDQSYKNALELFVSQLTNKIDALQVQVLELTKGLHVTQSEVADLKSQVKYLVREKVDDRRSSTKWNNQVHSPNKIAESLKSRCKYFDNYTHNRNLYLCGLEELKLETQEQLANRVSILLQDMLELPNTSLEQVKRVGQQCDPKPRPVLLTFSRPSDRNALVRNCHLLQGSDVYIYEEPNPMSLHARQVHEHRKFSHHSTARLNGNSDARTPHTVNGFSSEPHTPALNLPPSLPGVYDQHLASSAPSLAIHNHRDSSSSLITADSSLLDDDMGRGRQVLSVHVGQAGAQIGSVCWELYCLEHGIYEDGRPYPEVWPRQKDPDILQSSHICTPSSQLIPFSNSTNSSSLDAFFAETTDGKMVPRSVFVDLESSVIDEIRRGPQRELFHSADMVTYKEDAANNFARGYCSVGRKLLDNVMNRIREKVEAYSGLQGFMFTHSFGGGTGSGFMTLLLERMMEEYASTSLLRFCVLPSPRMSTAVVEPYNTILHASTTMDYKHCVFVFDNEAIYDLCANRLGVGRPTYKNINHLVAQVVSASTASLRFGGSLNVDLRDFNTNLVPLPRLHFPVMTYAPVISADSHCEQQSVTEMTKYCFDPSLQMTKCNPVNGKYMSCCLLYRGDVTPIEVQRATAAIKLQKNIQFVEWCGTGFKNGISDGQPQVLRGGDLARMRRAVCMLANTTALKDTWATINNKFGLMYSRRAFVHWYTGEGLEDSELENAKENVAQLVKEYEEQETDKTLEI